MPSLIEVIRRFCLLPDLMHLETDKIPDFQLLAIDFEKKKRIQCVTLCE